MWRSSVGASLQIDEKLWERKEQTRYVIMLYIIVCNKCNMYLKAEQSLFLLFHCLIFCLHFHHQPTHHQPCKLYCCAFRSHYLKLRYNIDVKHQEWKTKTKGSCWNGICTTNYHHHRHHGHHNHDLSYISSRAGTVKKEKKECQSYTQGHIQQLVRFQKTIRGFFLLSPFELKYIYACIHIFLCVFYKQA